MTESVRDYWPEDPRWGGGFIKPPLWGIYDEAYRSYVEEIVAEAKRVMAEFEEKYPDHHWWTPEFVEVHPAVALLLQAVNSTAAFPSPSAITELSGRVAEGNDVPFIDHSQSLEIQVAKLAMSSMLQHPEGGEELKLAHTIMTANDRIEATLLLNGVSRHVKDEA